MNPVQIVRHQFFVSLSNVILRLRPMALSQSALPSSDLRIAILFGFLIPIHATCLAHLAFLNLFTLMTKYLVTGTNYVGPT